MIEGEAPRHPRNPHLCPPWPKGTSGNPRGGSRGRRLLTAQIKRAIRSDPARCAAIVEAWLRACEGGSVRHLALLLDRIEGPVPHHLALDPEAAPRVIVVTENVAPFSGPVQDAVLLAQLSADRGGNGSG